MTVEEIQQEIAANPELKTGLIGALENDMFTHAKSKGIIVRTADEEKTFLKNYETSVIDPRVAKIYNDLDNDVKTTSGIEREDKEKTFAYTKRVISKLKGDITEMGTKLKAYEEGKGDELTKSQLAQLRKSLGEKETELENFKKSSGEDKFKLKAGFNVDNVLAAVKIYVPAHIPDAEKDAYIESRKKFIKIDFANNYKAEEVEGKVVYKNATGNIQMNPTTAAPKTEKELITEMYKHDFEPAGPKGGGAGSGGKGGKDDDETVTDASVVDKASLYAYLAKKGLVQGSKPWLDEFTKIKTAKGITE